MDKCGYVYAIGDAHGSVKIGITRVSPEARLASLQTGNSQPLTLLAACKCDEPRWWEWKFHEGLREIGLGQSGEWFMPSIHVTLMVAYMAQGELREAGLKLMEVWAQVDEHREREAKEWRTNVVAINRQPKRNRAEYMREYRAKQKGA